MPFFLNSDISPKLAPDRLEELSEEVPKNFIISRNKDGSVCSIFNDDIWDFRALGARSPFNFLSWHNGIQDTLSILITQEIKTITWLAMFNPSVAKKGKKPGSYASFLTAIRSLAKIAYRCGTSLENAHMEPRFQVALKASFASLNGDTTIRFHSTSLKEVIRCCYTSIHNSECSDLARWRIIPDEDYGEWSSRLAKVDRIQRDNAQRTPLIPTRILSSLLTEIEKELDKVIPYLDKLINFFEEIYQNPRLFCDDSRMLYKNKKRIAATGRTFSSEVVKASDLVGRKETLVRFQLEIFLHAEGVPNELEAITNFLVHKRLLASIFIFLYTGMRSSELKVMPYKCYKQVEIPSFGDVSCIFSHTRKIEQDHYSKLLPWVTSPIVKKALDVAQKITHICWIRNSATPFHKEEEAMPIWLATNWKRTADPVHYPYPIGDLFTNLQSSIESLSGITIQQSDLDELITFDAFRNWDEDPRFSVGRPWPLSSHQCRRSVAVYAARSGMVSLPTLSTQYKHMSIMMTALYSENSGFAESFILNKDGKVPDEFGVITDFREDKLFCASVAFEEQVIKSHQKLLGGRGNEFQIKKERDLPSFLQEAFDLKEMIKTGQIRYVQLPTGGGCMREQGPCESYGLDWTMPCAGCKDSTHDANALRLACESMEESLSEMDKESLAYKHTSERLAMIKQQLSGEE